VLTRALQPFPVPVRTLDAIHLAALVFIRTHPTKTAGRCDLPVMVVQAAAALFCGWFAFHFQGSRSAILLAG